MQVCRAVVLVFFSGFYGARRKDVCEEEFVGTGGEVRRAGMETEFGAVAWIGEIFVVDGG